MYPSETDSLFGVFVKNFKKELKRQNVIFSKVSVIKGKGTSLFEKLIRYSKHYISCFKNYYSYEYDLIYFHYLTHHIPVLLLFNNKKKIVVNSHGSDIIGLQTNKVLNFFAKKILVKIDLLVVPTSYFKSKVLDFYPFLNEKTIFVSPSAGIEPNKFYYKNSKVFDSNILCIGFVSRFIEEKGWETFLEALLILKSKKIKFNAIIAGKGPDESKILKYIKLNGLQKDVAFLGLVKQEELVDIYNKLDLYIFPTYREAESLGLTGLEAMSCGTPVVSCNVAGPTTYIKHQENGFLFPPKDANSLVENILFYYNLSPSEKKNLSQNALESAKLYESTFVSQNLYKRLSSLID